MRMGPPKQLIKMMAWVICALSLMIDTNVKVYASSPPATQPIAQLESSIILVKVKTFTSSVGRGTIGVAFSSDGRMLAAGWSDGIARVWDVKTGHEIIRFSSKRSAHHSNLHESCSKVQFSHNGQWLLTGGTTLWSSSNKKNNQRKSNNDAHLWDIKTGRELKEFSGHTDLIYTAAFSPDDKQIVTSSGDGTVRVWDVKSGRQLRQFKFGGPGTSVYCAYFSPDGQDISACGDAGLIVWKMSTGKTLWKTKTHIPETPVYDALAFSPNGERIASVGVAGVEVWNTKMPYELPCPTDGEKLFRLKNSLRSPSAILFLPNSHDLLTAGIQTVRTGIKTMGDPFNKSKMQGVVRLVNWWTGEEADLAYFSVPPSIAISPDGRYLATGGSKGVQLWRIKHRASNKTLDAAFENRSSRRRKKGSRQESVIPH